MAVVSGTPPSMTRAASASRYLGMSSANRFDECLASSYGLSTTALPAASALKQNDVVVGVRRCCF
jgi:hypothetical protein